MKCPVDTEVDLAMTERQGVEIDYCPTCRGVWLDRGELDKILDRAAEFVADSAPTVPSAGAIAPPPFAATRGDARYEPPRAYDRPQDDGPRDGLRDDSRFRDDSRARDDSRYRDDSRSRDDSRYRDDRDRPYAKKKRKESWLGDLLDFG